MSNHRKLYSCLAIQQSHCSLLKKIAITSQKSSQTLLLMLTRKNKQAQNSISQYSLQYKIKHQKPKTLPKVRVPSLLTTMKQKTLRISLDNENYKTSKELRKPTNLADLATPKKKPYQIKQKQHVRAQSKLSIIQFPTFGTELQLSCIKKPNSQHFVRRQLSNICNSNFIQYNKIPPILSPTILSSHQQQLLLQEFDSAYKPNHEKQNKPTHIRVRTFKNFQQHESARISTSRPSYLKPIPVQSFFSKFQSEAASRAELIQSRAALKKKL